MITGGEVLKAQAQAAERIATVQRQVESLYALHKERQCKCDMRTKLVGEVCNPERK